MTSRAREQSPSMKTPKIRCPHRTALRTSQSLMRKRVAPPIKSDRSTQNPINCVRQLVGKSSKGYSDMQHGTRWPLHSSLPSLVRNDSLLLLTRHPDHCRTSPSSDVLLSLCLQQGILQVLDRLHNVSPISHVNEDALMTAISNSIWVGMSGVFCIVLPIWESRKEIMIISSGLIRALQRRSRVEPTE